jgi:hypothetical protein
MVFGRQIGKKLGRRWGLHIRKKHRKGKEK